MLTILKRAALAATMASLAVPAAAATFDFTGGNNGANGNYDGDYSATVDGVTVNVTAGLYDGTDLFGSSADAIIFDDCSVSLCVKEVAKRNQGLGVGIPLPTFFGPIILNPELDGTLDELITFTFSQVVNFSSITFATFDGNDDFDLFIDGMLVSEENNIASQNPFGPFGSGTSFSVGADAFGDSFRIASIEVAAVPLPAGFALLLTGLGGLGLMRRRRAA